MSASDTMTPTGKMPRLIAPLLAGWLCCATTFADPAHKVGDDGAWCHVDSGWMFPARVGEFTRIRPPYTIDGNNDVGAQYQQPNAAAIVEIYAADSAAADATLIGAKANAARKAGELAHATADESFRIDAKQDLSGVKVSYVAEPESSGPQTHLYFFATDRWHVKVLVTAPTASANAAQAPDTFVQSLPWNTLGTESGIH